MPRGRSTNRTTNRINESPSISLPDALKACLDGWVEKDTSNTSILLLMSESAFQALYLRDSIKNSFAGLNEKIEARLTNQAIDSFDILLPNAALSTIVDSTSECLDAAGFHPTDAIEYRRFILHRLLSRIVGETSKLAWKKIMPMLAEKHGFELMDEDRYKALLTKTRGFPLDNRRGDGTDENWVQQNHTFRQLNEVERSLFNNTIRYLLNKKDGVIVVDDELIPSRAGDVELKTLSNRKSGKDGPVADCISDSCTGVLLGMRLRVREESQQENVEALVRTLPDLTSNEQSIRMCFDHGYGKFDFIQSCCARNYNISTIASTMGSRHPFITQDEIASQKSRWKAKKFSDEEIDGILDTIKAFILDADDMLGPAVRAAVREVTLASGRKKTIVATAQREKYDRKVAFKDLRFFSSGAMEMTWLNVWVAQNKRFVETFPTLFYTKEDALCLETEVELLKSCYPVTVAQRTADWFCQKAFRLTGTMAGKLFASTIFTGEEPIRDKNKQDLLDDLFQSWFGRHRGSTEAMKVGSLNEAPVAQKLATQSWVDRFFDIGLVEWKEANYVGVSPDGVLRFTIPEGDNLLDPPVVLACVEIKTRSAVNTILAAEEAAEKHGTVVCCQYDDNIFKDCVPSENRLQILHQALVTGLKYGVFVVSKVEKGEGSLVQILVIKIETMHKQSLSDFLLGPCRDLVGWILSPTIINRGYMVQEDFPQWVNARQRKIITSHMQLFAAQYKLIKQDGGAYTPSPPVNAYKCGLQHAYNKGKWGLDKNTENCNSISVKSNLSFESKYIHRMIDGVVFNQWRVEQGRKIIKPYVIQNPNAKVYQIRIKASQYTLIDHVYELSIKLLKRLDKESLSMVCGNTQVPFSEGQRVIQQQVKKALDYVARRKAKGKWPPKTYRIKQYSETEELRLLRTLNTSNCRHVNGKIGKNIKENEGRSRCALCEVRRTRYECKLCGVALCVTIKGGPEGSANHFTRWHNAIDLVAESERATQEENDYKIVNKINGNDDDDDDDEDDDEDDNHEEEEDDDNR